MQILQWLFRATNGQAREDTYGPTRKQQLMRGGVGVYRKFKGIEERKSGSKKFKPLAFLCRKDVASVAWIRQNLEVCSYRIRRRYGIDTYPIRHVAYRKLFRYVEFKIRLRYGQRRSPHRSNPRKPWKPDPVVQQAKQTGLRGRRSIAARWFSLCFYLQTSMLLAGLPERKKKHRSTPEEEEEEEAHASFVS